ncbi:MAG: ATPase domain-containing protein [Bacillota bacterium]
MERIPTGICELDKLLTGGFPEGSTILIAGRPGSNKRLIHIVKMRSSAHSASMHELIFADNQLRIE